MIQVALFSVEIRAIEVCHILRRNDSSDNVDEVVHSESVKNPEFVICKYKLGNKALQFRFDYFLSDVCLTSKSLLSRLNNPSKYFLGARNTFLNSLSLRRLLPDCSTDSSALTFLSFWFEAGFLLTGVWVFLRSGLKNFGVSKACSLWITQGVLINDGTVAPLISSIWKLAFSDK